MLFVVLNKCLGEDTKGEEIGMYWVSLMLGVTTFLGLGTIWIAWFTINGIVLNVGWGSEGGPKLSTKYHDH